MAVVERVRVGIGTIVLKVMQLCGSFERERYQFFSVQLLLLL